MRVFLLIQKPKMAYYYNNRQKPRGPYGRVDKCRGYTGGVVNFVVFSVLRISSMCGLSLTGKRRRQ